MKKKIRFLKTMLLAIILLVGGNGVAWGQYSGIGTFNKITSLTDLTDGYYVIVNSGDAQAMNNNTTQVTGCLGNTLVSPSSGVITNPPTTIVWKIESNSGSRTIYNEASAKYVSYTGTSNNVQVVDAVTANNQRWSFTYASSVFSVTNVALNTRILQYNSSTPRYACYTSAQQKLLLYKMANASSYTITYNSNGGTGTMTDTNSPYSSGTNVTVMTNTFTKSGFTFAGWNTAANGSGTSYSNGATISGIAANTTLYAQWVSSDATLSALSLSAGALSPSFSASTETYTASVTNATSSITVTPTRNQANATIQAQVNGGGYSTVTSGSASGALALNIGDNTVNVLVTAQDGTTTKTYTITVTREAALTPQTITFDALSAVTYGVSPFVVSATGGGSGNPVTFTSSDETVATCTGTNGATVTILKAGSCSIYANQAGNASYNSASQVAQTLTVNAKALTISDAAVTTKTYNGTNAAVITGTLTGIINSDDVTFNGTGTFADVNVADGIAVTSTSTLGGTKAANYSLTQPTSLSGNITKANQTISGVAASATKFVGDANYTFAATSTTSGTNALSYLSSNPSVATINASTGLVQILAAGVTTITVSQGASANYNAASDASQVLTVNSTPSAVVTLRPSHIDLTSSTSESAVLMTLSNYSSNDAKYRLYSTNQYSCWDESTDSYITSSTYSAGPNVPGSPSTSSTFWIVFQRGTNNTTGATYRDRLGSSYGTNYQTVSLPAATSISSGFTLSGNFIGTPTYNNSVKHVVLAYSSSTLISACGTTLSTGAFSAVCPFGTTIDKIEIRAIDNTLIESITGSWTSTSTLGGIPTPTFTGTGEWSETARWNTGSVPGTTQSVVIDGTATINSNVEVTGLTINTGKSLNVNAAKQLTVSSTMTNNGTLNLLSSESGTATILTPVTISGSGTASVNQDLTSVRNWYVSSPITSAQSSSLPAGTLWKYNEPNTGVTGSLLWDLITSNEALEVMQGYIFKPTSTGLINFTGTLNTGDKSITVNRTENGKGGRGFNLVGNPYPSYINIANLTSNADLVSTIWYRSNNSGYVFDTYNITSGLATGLSGKSVTNKVPPMQAFWVQVASGKASATVNLLNANRSHQDNSNNKFRTPAENTAVNKVVRLKVNGGNRSDEAVVYFNPNAANSFDAYDSPKMLNGSTSTIPDIYTSVGAEQLVINGMKEILYDTEIPIYFKANASIATSFTLLASEISNFEEGTPVYIKNKLTGEQKIISDGSEFTFATSAIGTDPAFSLIIKAPGTVSGLNKTLDKNVIVFVDANKKITVNTKSIAENSRIIVYNSVGQQLVAAYISGNVTVLKETFTPCVYVVKVNDISHKVIVK